jgi:hypothetical protein
VYEPLPEKDRIKLARFAGYVHHMTEEADRANCERERLKQADDATLRARLCDQEVPTLSRVNALVILVERHRSRGDGVLSGIVLPLWTDPDDELARFAIRCAPQDDPEVTARLHALLDDPRSHRWSVAASVLAQRRDRTIVTRLLGWFREGDQEHRNVAWSCLCYYRLLEADACRAFLREAWDAGGRDDDDRAMLAVGLLGLGDHVGWAFLVDLAHRADCHTATWAAETVMEHDPALGLDLILHVLDHGKTFEVRWGMVERVAQAAGLPHVWTVDGLAEARYWIEQQRQRIQSGHVVGSLHSHRLAALQASPP